MDDRIAETIYPQSLSLWLASASESRNVYGWMGLGKYYICRVLSHGLCDVEKPFVVYINIYVRECAGCLSVNHANRSSESFRIIFPHEYGANTRVGRSGCVDCGWTVVSDAKMTTIASW